MRTVCKYNKAAFADLRYRRIAYIRATGYSNRVWHKEKTVIKAEQLYFSYSGTAPFVLENLGLEIRRGEYVSVVGENGSGKSTLIRLILKFLKPTRGSIQRGTDRIGYVPQRNDFSNSGFPITVFEALDSYRRLLSIKDRTAVEESLARLDMTAFSGALMGSLSGGQSQKIFIARSLLGNPELLILDEPSTGVDPGSQKEIYGFIKKLNEEKGLTIVSVEHNLDAAVSNSTQIYHIAGGRGHLCTPKQYVEEFLGKR
jgi:zinc transport system ATP-binding protein